MPSLTEPVISNPLSWAKAGKETLKTLIAIMTINAGFINLLKIICCTNLRLT
jgi:hypothetical protein